MSRTNIELDDQLVRQGLKLGGFKTKRQLVHVALENYIRKHFDETAGFLKTGGKLSRKLLKDRKNDRSVREKRRPLPEFAK